MKNLFNISILLLLLASCGKNTRTIIVNTQNADGLTTETKLDVNGLEIGKVVDISLNADGTVDLFCEIDNNEIEIPLDSKFYSKDLGLLGGKNIGIKIGTANKLIETGMSIKLTEQNSKVIEDVFSKAINEVKSLLGGQHNTDSLLFELRRLNKNMEDLKLERKNN